LNNNLVVNLPVSYDFFLGSEGPEIQSWSLEFDFGTSLASSFYGSYTATGGSGSGTFSGAGLITLSSYPTANTTVWETVTLNVNTAGNGGDVYIEVPEPSSFDYDSVPIPEPATAGTLAAGLGFLTWLFRRRKRA